MKLRSFAAVGLALSLASLAACDQKPNQAKPSSTVAGDPTAEAKRLIAGGATVVDVREQDEWDEGHLPQAKHVPVAAVGARVAEIEAAAGGKDKPIVVYCKAGGRAGRAKETLEAAGFTNVTNGGGYRALAAP